MNQNTECRHSYFLFTLFLLIFLLSFEVSAILTESNATIIDPEFHFQHVDTIKLSGECPKPENANFAAGAGIPVKLTDCKDSLSAEDISLIHKGFAAYNDDCDPELHHKVWTDFWLDRERSNVWDLFNNTDLRPTKIKICSELVYQTCDKGTSKCDCSFGAVFIGDHENGGKCKLVEGSNVDQQCGDDLVPYGYPGLHLKSGDGALVPLPISDKRACLLGFKLECAGSSKCMCLVVRPSPTSSGNKSICNFRDDENGLLYAGTLVNATLSKAMKLNWIEFGQKCLVYNNFNSKFTSHNEAKRTVVIWLENFVTKANLMCDPFQNLECDNEQKLCMCAAGFIRQDDECRLRAMSSQDLEAETEIRSEDQQVCEWYPEFQFMLGHQVDHDNPHSAAENKTHHHYQKRWFAQTVPCVENAECVENPKHKLKFCFCNEGAVCQSEEERGIGSRQKLNQNIWIFSAVAEILMYLTPY